MVLVKPTPAWIGVGSTLATSGLVRTISPSRLQSRITAVPSVPFTYQRGSLM
ncbi:hypothetical protein D3C81_2148920 [compost metagenome]